MHPSHRFVNVLQMFDMGTGDDSEEVLVEGVPPESYLERFQVRVTAQGHVRLARQWPGVQSLAG